MNLPDAIERLRALRAETLDRISKWGAIERAHLCRPNGVMTEAFTLDAQALAVCLEALAGHVHDGGALLREVNPKARTPIDTTKSAPPLTPEEQAKR